MHVLVDSRFPLKIFDSRLARGACWQMFQKFLGEATTSCMAAELVPVLPYTIVRQVGSQ
jgi:hypothetical protein